MNSVLFVLLTIVWACSGAKILFIAPFPTHSHFTLCSRLAKELASRNHEVSVVSPFPQKDPISNYNDISIVDLKDYVVTIVPKIKETMNRGVLGGIFGFFDMGYALTEFTLQHEKIQALLRDKTKFDLVILEHFANEAMFGLATAFDAPYIVLNPLRPNSLMNFLVENPAPSSYVPNLLGTLFTKNMNFVERLQNFVFNTALEAVRHVFYLPKHKDLVRRYIDHNIDLDQVIYQNLSLVLSNSHHSINDPVPTVPAIVEIGGYHVTPPKQLPEDLQKFLDAAQEGVILFSMGSTVQSKDLKPEVRAAILRSFAKIKHQVLWKFETELPEAPANVKIMPWIPQSDILAHPNIRVFISHGGLLGSIEAIYHGVPVIGIPVMGDQKSNIARAVSNGYAIGLPLDDITEESFTQALTSILEDPKYTENVKRRSKLMHDQPLKPIDKAVYWIEYVIRHKGAPFLRSAGLDLIWYQRELVDIFAFIVFIIFAFIIISYIIINKFVTLFTGNKPKKVFKSKKNN